MGMMNDRLTSELFPPALPPVMLQGPVDLAGFRRAARMLLAQHILPEQVSWHTSGSALQDLFAADPDNCLAANAAAFDDAPAVKVPAEFLALCESVILHSDPARFGLLYRILWRLAHEPGLRHDPLDADIVKAGNLAQAVRRDMHKMKAFVRFRTVQDDIFRTHPEGGPLHVAWFEPEHHIVEAIAPFFARRFAQMRWAILTPERSAEWDCVRPRLRGVLPTSRRTGCGPGDAVALPSPTAPDGLALAGASQGELRFGPGAQKSDAPPADAGEQLWLTYYQNTFNPARLKFRTMQKEMPRKYWRNLPEAVLISPLAAAANERSLRMVAQPATQTLRRLPLAGVATRPEEGEGEGRQAVSSLAMLQDATGRCRDCPIGEQATRLVCGEGPHTAQMMFVGEQPGDQEDLAGRPFIGPAGQLLDRALRELGIARHDVFLTNAVKHFKFELRGQRRIHKTPSLREAAACLHWLDDEIRLVRPQVLVALGATAARALMGGEAVPVMAKRGQWLQRADGRRVLVTLHPAALLRLPPEEQASAYAAWLADLSALKKLSI
ncbi:MAG: hypothetical protein JWR68_191 [Polaromonas sp.]|nr:hypothetical protein [Polaromonas sp.]